MAKSTDLPVTKAFVKVGLTGGINAKQDPHQLANGQLKTADNVVFGAVDGQVTKRFGCESINPQGAPLQGGPFKAIGIRDGIEPLILGANTLNKYNVAQRLSTSMPTPTQGRVDVKQVAGSSGQTLFPWPPSDPSCATDGTQYVCVTWQEPNATCALCYYGVQDLATGTWIIPPTPIPRNTYVGGANTYIGQQCPSVRYYNGSFYIFYLVVTQDASLNYYSQLGYGLLPLTNLSGGFTVSDTASIFTGQTTSVAVSNSPGPYGYDVHIANGIFISSVGPSLSDRQTFSICMGAVAANGSLNLTQVKSFATTQAISYQRCAVRCDGPAATPYLVATGDCLVYYTSSYVMTKTDIATGSLQPLPVDCKWLPDGTALWVGSRSLVGMQTGVMRLNLSTKVTTWLQYASPVNSSYTQVLSRLFTIAENSKIYVWTGAGAPSSDDVYNGAYLAEFDFAKNSVATVCRTLYMRNAHITNGDMTVPCDVVKVAGTSKYVTFLSSSLEKTTKSYHTYGALNRVEFDFAPTRSTQLISLPTGGVLGAGAYPFLYDGVSVSEAGFSFPPSGDQIQSSLVSATNYIPYVGSAASGLAGGASAITTSGYIEYYYVICFVRRDAYGNVYRSSPSPVITAPCPNAFNTVQFPAYNYNGGGNVMIEYYRSTQNVTGSHYFIGQAANGQPFTDRTGDGSTMPSTNTSITKNRIVYTDASELPNDPPPAVHHAAVGETRVFMIPSDARNTIWFSKTFSSGRTVEFSANNVLSEGNSTALFTAVALLDSNVIVFKEDQIVYFSGDGPDNKGDGSFSTFQRITADVGCIEPSSIVTVPDGILFRSRRGIEMINRSLQVSYIGAPVEPLLRDLGPISSTVLVPRFTQVRFVPQTAGKPVLVFDYKRGVWSTFSNMASVSARSMLDSYWWISADGTKVYRETPDAYTDDGAPIVLTLETPEIPVGAGGVQGWGRAYRMALLGDFYSDHVLNISFAYDHQTDYPDSVNFDTKTGLVSGDAVYQFRCSRLPRSVMQTLRIKITESGTVGQSCAISTIALEVGSKNGLAKLASQKTV